MGHKRRTILIVGPIQPRFTGGIASFVRSMLSSQLLAAQFRLEALDNSLAPAWRSSLATRLAASLILSLRLAGRIIRLRPSAVHIHSSSFSSFWEKAAFLTVCRLLGRFTILHLHGGSFEDFYQASHSKWLIRLFLSHANILVTLSPRWRFFFGSISHGRVEVVPNCAGDDYFAVKADASTGETVVFAGEVGTGKGVDVLIEAFRMLRERGLNNPLILAGGCGRGDSLEAWGTRARQAGLDKVQFPGPLSPGTLAGLFGRAALFTLPSRTEGLPIAMLEAMAAGLPVVVTPVGGIPDAVQDGEQGFLVPVGDSRQLADRIESLLKDPLLRRTMGENARRTATLKYNTGATARALLEIYNSLPG